MSILSPELLSVIMLAFCLAGLVKGAIGLGTPIIVVPIISGIIGLPQAMAILVVPMMVSNGWQIWSFRHAKAETEFVWPFVVTSGIGIVVGTRLLLILHSAILFIVLSMMLLVYVGVTIFVPKFKLSRKTGVRLAPGVGLVAGALQGIAGISAPITLTFLTALRLERETFIFAVSVIFIMYGVVQGVSLTVAGITTMQTLLVSLLALVPMAICMPLGAAVSRRMSKKAFTQAILALLVVLAVRMLYTGISIWTSSGL